MGTLDRFKRNENLENDGIELDLGDGIIVTVRRAGGSNKKYAAVMRREYKKRKHAVDADLLTEEEGRQMMADVYADAVIIDWKGITDDKGKAIPYSRENVVKTLVAYPEFFEVIKGSCEERENFRQAELEQEGSEQGN